MRLTVSIHLLLALLLLWVGEGYAQVTTATFYTIITDPSDAVVADATVTLREERTRVANEKVTDPSGECAFTFVPIGIYTVTIKATGFKTLTVSGLTLDGGQNVRRKFVLEVGEIAEKVDVTAEAPLVNTVSAEQLEGVKWAQMSELPLARRRASDVFTIGTAILRTGAGNTGGSFLMNGLGRGGSNLTMDGIPASGHPATPQAGLRGGFNYIEIVSLEAIQEVNVAKGAFSAEYAHALAGNINVITKSGTNEWHGSLFEAFNAEELNGRPAFLRTRPALTFNQFGGSLGGPLRKDKIFIFGVYEGYRDRRFSTLEGEVPSQRLRDAMIARVPEYKLILDQFFLPNQPHAPNAPTGRYIGPFPFNANTDHFVIKPDVWLSSKAKVSATWLRERPDRIEASSASSPGPNSARKFVGEVDRLNVTFTTFGTNWSAETRYGRNRVDNDRSDEFIEVKDPNKQESRFGGRRLTGIIAFGFQKQGELNFVGNVSHQIIEQKATLQRGRHSLKFGGLWNRRGYGGANIENPTLNYNTEEELLNNTPVNSLFTFGVDPYLGRAQSWGLFLQDDWKVSPKLVLNLGLRYDFFGRMTVRGLDGGKSPALYNPPFIDFPNFVLGPFRHMVDDGYDNDAKNFGPRFGFAYNPDGKGKIVVRGGFGIMFSPPNLSIFEQTMINSLDAPFRTELSRAELARLGIRFPAYAEDVLILVQGGAAVPAYQLVDPKLKAPYAMNFTLGFQCALSGTMMLESAFVGTRGLKLTNQRIYNQPNALTGIRPNPRLGQARYWDNSDSSVYTSWQTSFRKRSHHLTGAAHYTWGKALAYNDGDTTFGIRNTIQEFFDIRSNRGRSRDDIQHSFVGSLVYDLPVFSNASPVLRHILGSWQGSGIFRAQTGVPLTIDQTSARAHGRPDLIDFKGAILDEGLQYLNRAAFQRVPISPASGLTIRPGSAGNNVLSGPGQWNLDFSLAKNFRIREQIQFQFRADMLNAFNHVNLIAIVTRIDRSNFGSRVGATDPRAVQFHLRLSF